MFINIPLRAIDLLRAINRIQPAIRATDAIDIYSFKIKTFGLFDFYSTLNDA